MSNVCEIEVSPELEPAEMTDLKPCPFCGPHDVGLSNICKPRLIEETQFPFRAAYVTCPMCYAKGSTAERTHHEASLEEVAEKAITVWNRLPREPEWTETPPSEPGMYQIRKRNVVGCFDYFDEDRIAWIKANPPKLKTEYSGPILLAKEPT